MDRSSPVSHDRFIEGIYATRSALYALPYYATAKDPAIIIGLFVPGTTITISLLLTDSFLITLFPGNAYPVVEDPDEKKSMMGRPLKSGYQVKHSSSCIRIAFVISEIYVESLCPHE